MQPIWSYASRTGLSRWVFPDGFTITRTVEDEDTSPKMLALQITDRHQTSSSESNVGYTTSDHTRGEGKSFIVGDRLQ
jgi:hypothetical protein